jgi:hypothetical protein
MADENGKRQLDFLVAEGLRPSMRLVDLGGEPRDAVPLVRWLEAGHYSWIGRDREAAAAELAGLVPAESLLANDEFEVWRFRTEFDQAVAGPLFTRLAAGDIRRCLLEVSRCMKRGGRLYASFFECPPDHPRETAITHEPGGVVTHGDRAPYHYRVGDFEAFAIDLPWVVESLGDWGHPRSERMLRFTRQ